MICPTWLVQSSAVASAGLFFVVVPLMISGASPSVIKTEAEAYFVPHQSEEAAGDPESWARCGPPSTLWCVEGGPETTDE